MIFFAKCYWEIMYEAFIWSQSWVKWLIAHYSVKSDADIFECVPVIFFSSPWKFTRIYTHMHITEYMNILSNFQTCHSFKSQRLMIKVTSKHIIKDSYPQQTHKRFVNEILSRVQGHWWHSNMIVCCRLICLIPIQQKPISELINIWHSKSLSHDIWSYVVIY